MRTYYMHTMDDRPAAVQRHDPGKPWLAYAGKSITAVQMCDSLQQLRKEQRQCFLAMSEGCGMGVFQDFRVWLPNAGNPPLTENVPRMARDTERE
jgi:hypothetical protein